MKVGDLVVFSEGYTLKGDDLWNEPQCPRGIVIEGPMTFLNGVRVYWMLERKSGWWDQERLSVINESR